MTTPEGKVKDACKRVLKANGAWYFMPVQNGMGIVGIPDFVCCVPYEIKAEDVGQTVGLFLGLETKAPGKLSTLTPNQQRVIEAIRACDGLADVVDDAATLTHLLETLHD